MFIKKIISAEKSISNWSTPTQNHAPSFLKAQIASRACHLILIPSSAVAALANFAVGMITALSAAVTFGQEPELFDVTQQYLDGSGQVLAQPYINLLKTINPQASTPFIKHGGEINYIKTLQNMDGLFTVLLSNKLNKTLNKCYRKAWKSKYSGIKKLAARVGYALLPICYVISRVADLILGLIALPLSLLTCGKFKTWNRLTYQGLGGIGHLAADVVLCLLNCIQPCIIDLPNSEIKKTAVMQGIKSVKTFFKSEQRMVLTSI